MLPLRQPDGSMAEDDIRGVPFLRFEDNECHSEGLYSFFFGDDPAGSVHGDKQHPFIARNLMAWETHYALRPGLTHFLMEHLDIENGAYGVYHPDYNAHVYRDVRVSQSEHRADQPRPRRREHPVRLLHLRRPDPGPLHRHADHPALLHRAGGGPDRPLPQREGHPGQLPRPRTQRVIDLGVGPILPDKDLIKGRRLLLPRHRPPSPPAANARVVSEKFPALMTGGDYKTIPGFTGKRVRAAEVEGVEFPQLLDPVDDLPPATIITSVRKEGGKLLVRGVTQDNGEVATVDGERPAREDRLPACRRGGLGGDGGTRPPTGG